MMNKTPILPLALALSALLACSSAAAAPVVIAPGSSASYFFLPAAGSSVGEAGSDDDLKKERDTCFSEIRSGYAKFTVPYDTKITYLLVGGGGGDYAKAASYNTITGGAGGGSSAIVNLTSGELRVARGGDGGRSSLSPAKDGEWLRGSIYARADDVIELVIGGGGGGSIASGTAAGTYPGGGGAGYYGGGAGGIITADSGSGGTGGGANGPGINGTSSGNPAGRGRGGEASQGGKGGVGFAPGDPYYSYTLGGAGYGGGGGQHLHPPTSAQYPTIRDLRESKGSNQLKSPYEVDYSIHYMAGAGGPKVGSPLVGSGTGGNAGIAVLSNSGSPCFMPEEVPQNNWGLDVDSK